MNQCKKKRERNVKDSSHKLQRKTPTNCFPARSPGVGIQTRERKRSLVLGCLYPTERWIPAEASRGREERLFPVTVAFHIIHGVTPSIIDSLEISVIKINRDEF
jgi:hypothetical protein